MKTRIGFVSNSSSSSFVLKVGLPFDTIFDVAEWMIPKRGWDNDEELLEKLRKQKIKYINTPAISFKSCNYDTFIAKMGDYFLIETCHNHDWDLNDFRCNCPDEFYHYFGDDSFYELPHKIEFYSLEYDFLGRIPTWEESHRVYGSSYCDMCQEDFWIINRKIICPICKREKIV